MKYIKHFKDAALHIAVRKNNVEIVRILLSNKNIDVNSKSVYQHFF